MELNNLPQPENISIQPEKKKKIFFPILISVLITAIVVGSGVYYWQQVVKRVLVFTMERKISDLTASDRLNRAVIQECIKETDYMAKAINQQSVCQQNTCEDSDSKEKDNGIYVRGDVFYKYINKDGSQVSAGMSDQCSDDNTQVIEMLCSEIPEKTGDFVPIKEIYNCPKGCQNGACNK